MTTPLDVSAAERKAIAYEESRQVLKEFQSAPYGVPLTSVPRMLESLIHTRHALATCKDELTEQRIAYDNLFPQLASQERELTTLRARLATVEQERANLAEFVQYCVDYGYDRSNAVAILAPGPGTNVPLHICYDDTDTQQDAAETISHVAVQWCGYCREPWPCTTVRADIFAATTPSQGTEAS